MKKSQIQQVIREEIKKALNENAPTQLMSIPVVAKAVNDVIHVLKRIDIDGETMQYILREVGMDDQMKSQLSSMNEDDGMAYGEQEAIDELNTNKQLQALLKRIPGFVRMVGLTDDKLMIAFETEEGAIKAADMLDVKLPGPLYQPKPGGPGFLIKIDAKNPAQQSSY